MPGCFIMGLTYIISLELYTFSYLSWSYSHAGIQQKPDLLMGMGLCCVVSSDPSSNCTGRIW